MALTKRQRRALRKNGILDERETVPQRGMKLKRIVAKTDNQQKTFDSYDDGQHLLLHGSPGTGKTFLSLYLSLFDIFEYKDSEYEKVIIIRSATPSKEIGFLPGKEGEKLAAFEAPYKGICAELFGRGDAYDILKMKNLIEFQSTSFLRGTTLDNCIVILDECQNLMYMELKTVLTRIGAGTRLIMCGDLYQDDLTSERFNQKSGLFEAMRIFDNIDSMTKIEFGIDDIVRSGFVREFIIAEHDICNRNKIETIRAV